MPLPPHIQVRHECLTFVVLGATGSLARNKLLPSIFNLYAAGHLPPRTLIVAAGRAEHTDRSFGDVLSRCIADSWKPPKQPKGGNQQQGPFSSSATTPSSPTAPLTSRDIGGSNLGATSSSARSLSLQSAESPKAGAGAVPGSPTASFKLPVSPGKTPTVPQGLVDEFLDNVKYVQLGTIPNGTGNDNGNDDDNNYLAEVLQVVARHEEEHMDASGRNRVFYLALPHELYPPLASAIHASGRSDAPGWTRLVLEKPHGIDLPSAMALNNALAARWNERELYRIDRYLGKEVIDNLLVMRFANRLLTPIWNRENVSNVQIIFKEPIGVSTRYFDSHGIIRDVVQNHLLQVLAVLAMDRPVSLDPEDIRDAKLKVLRQVNRVNPAKDVVVGQYTAGAGHGGYRDHPDVTEGSRAPTFAMMVLNIRNERWDGVPFILKAGKALNEKRSEIRIQLRPTPGDIFAGDWASGPGGGVAVAGAGEGELEGGRIIILTSGGWIMARDRTNSCCAFSLTRRCT